MAQDTGSGPVFSFVLAIKSPGFDACFDGMPHHLNSWFYGDA